MTAIAVLQKPTTTTLGLDRVLSYVRLHEATALLGAPKNKGRR